MKTFNLSKIIPVIVLIVIISIFSIHRVYSDGTKGTDNVSIKVSNIKVKELTDSHNFIGVNWVSEKYSSYKVLTYSKYRQSLIAALKKTGVDIIRYPGGNTVTHFFWNVPNEDIYTSFKKLGKGFKSFGKYNKSSEYSPEYRYDFKRFLDFCKENDLKATVQVNTQTYFDKENKKIVPLKKYELNHNGYKKLETGKVDWKLVEQAAISAGKQVKWAKENGYSDLIKYWELGNEEYAVLELKACYFGKQYGRVAGMFINEMKKADPSIKIILTSVAAEATPGETPVFRNNAWLNNWALLSLNELEHYTNKENVFAVTNHIYNWGNTTKDTSFNNFRNHVLTSSGYTMNKEFEAHNIILSKSGFKDTPVFINEFNAGPCNNRYSQTWLGAIANADMIISCANKPSCYHVDFFTMMHDYGNHDDFYRSMGMGMLHFAENFQQPILFHPVASVISELNHDLKGNILLTEYNQEEITATTAVYDNKMKIIILNKKIPRTISLDIDNFSNIELIQTKSIGINVPENFTIIEYGDSPTSPEQVSILNVMDNVLKVTKDGVKYKVEVPKNTISTIVFKFKPIDE